MQNAIAGNSTVPRDGRDQSFHMVVSDLVSLMDRVQASMRLVETAQVQADGAESELADIVVLDDVTPCYAQASAALGACNASLSAALQFLIEGRVPATR